MAFVLVAIFVFFGLVVLFFITVNLSNVKDDVQDLSREQAKELAYQLARTPEFIWHDDTCSSCVDSFKALLLKDYKELYLSYWNLDYLVFETIYPEKVGECNLQTYPNCKTITLVNKTNYYGTPATAYIALCRDAKIDSGGSYQLCELGIVRASVRGDS